MDILEDPPLPVGGFLLKIGCAERGAAGSATRASMEETKVRCAKLAQQIAHCVLKLVCVRSRFDDRAMPSYRRFPFRIQLLGRVKPFLQCCEHILKNGVPVLCREFNRQCWD